MLRAAHLPAVVIGAMGSLASLMFVGRNNTSWVLAVLFIGWVVSPFIALVLAEQVAQRWPAPVRTALHLATFGLVGMSLAVYIRRALTPPQGPAAFVFVATPLVSLAFVGVAVIVCAIVARRSSRRSF